MLAATGLATFKQNRYLVAAPKENPPPGLVAPNVVDPKLNPDIFVTEFVTFKYIQNTANWLNAFACQAQMCETSWRP